MVKDRPRPPLRVSIRCNSCSGGATVSTDIGGKGRPRAHHIPRPIQKATSQQTSDAGRVRFPFGVEELLK
jgi:hypothetical protein